MENHKEIIIPLLEADDIEVRIQQACKDNKALALLYKTSRTDMRILDKVFGVYGWKDEYKEIKGNLYCGISIYDKEKQEWITKWDCGIESQQEDGNERKAEASDATKRAGFKLGIGRELYSAPLIFINAETKAVSSNGNKTKYALVNPYERYKVACVAYNEKREISKLEIVDSKGNTVYSFNCGKKPKISPVSETAQTASKNTTAPKKCVTTQNTPSHRQQVKDLIKDSSLTMETVDKWVMQRFKKTDINYCTQEEFEKITSGIKSYMENNKGTKNGY